MLAFARLHQMERRLCNRRVLSVFVDTSATGPAGGAAWREELNRALARLDATPPYPSSGERTARELCMAHLRTALEGTRDAPGRPAWVAYVTTDDVVAAGAVRGRLETGVFWQNGIVVGPLLSARAKSRAVALGDIGFGHVAGDLDDATGGIAATLRTRPVDSSNARTSSHATPA